MTLSIPTAVLLASSALAQQLAWPRGRTPNPLVPEDNYTLLLAADLDNDGDQDLAACNQAGLWILRRTGKVSWAPEQLAWTTTPQVQPGVKAAAWDDFDQDGDLDLFVGFQQWLPAPMPAGVFRNDGTNFTWMGQIPMTLYGGMTGVASGDIDGDGFADVVIGNGGGTQVRINDGTGGFGTIPLTISTGANAVPALFDRDGDGDLDLAIASDGGLELFDNTGGSLVATTAPLPTTLGTRVVAADLDQDGRVDLAVVDDSRVDVLWNDPAGWTLASAVLAGSWPVLQLAVGDIDMDGDADLVARFRDGVDWLQNGGSRTFLRRAGLRHGGAGPTDTMEVANLTGRAGDDVVCGWFDRTMTVLYTAPVPFEDPIADLRVPAILGAPLEPAVGDVDGDGIEDLVFPGMFTAEPQVVRRDGRGVLRSTPIPGGSRTATRAWLCDLDDDSDLDLVLGEDTGLPLTVQILTNDGAGGFTVAQNVQPPFYAQELQFGDIDADGDIDILSGQSGQVDVIENRGTAGFVPVGPYPGVVATSGGGFLRAGDLDGDGDLDFLLGRVTAGVPVFLGDGTGGYTIGGVVPTSYYLSNGDLVDVDRDGDLDFVSPVRPGGIQVFRNSGAGTFAEVPGALPPGPVGFRQYLFDLDGDGAPEIFDFAYTPKLYRNDGSGTFTDATGNLFATSFGGLEQFAFGDFDGDGDDDVLVRIGGTWRRFQNRQRDAWSQQIVRPGGQLRVNFEATATAPGTGTAILPMVSFSPGPPLEVTGLAGRFQLPTTGSFLVAVLAAPTNTATWSVAIPQHPSFVGLGLFVQGLVVGPNVIQGYTNLVYERVLP
ncbi:MAG: VCBS repeat-containing protein [Planctomycetes bacterium]|nr:VCBS repeat-containing protein [Planctomycetota bacterium]